MDIGIGDTMVIPRLLPQLLLSKTSSCPLSLSDPDQGRGKTPNHSDENLLLLSTIGGVMWGSQPWEKRCDVSTQARSNIAPRLIASCPSRHSLGFRLQWAKKIVVLPWLREGLTLSKFQYLLFHVYARNSIKIIQLQYFAIWCNLHDICQFSPFNWSICWYVLWDIVTPCHSIVIHIDAVVCSPFSTSPGRSPLYSGKFQWKIPAWANSIIDWLWLVVEVMSSMRVMWLEWLMRIKFKATKLVKPTSTIVVDAALNQPVNSGSYNILSKEI